MARLAIVLSHPVQYYSPWFRWLQANTSLKFKVFYLWKFGVTAQQDPQFNTTFQWDVDLLSGYESEFVPNISRDPGTHHFRGLNNPTLGTRLSEWKPDAVLLFGYNWLSLQRALWWARLRKVPVLFRGDSHLLGRGTLPISRRLPLSLLYRQFTAFLYVGNANRDYFRALGVPAGKLFFAPHSVNAAHFNPADEATRARAMAVREQLGLTGHRIVLFAGKFHSRKQPVELLEAFQSVAGAHHALLFVGDGDEKKRLQAAAAKTPHLKICFLPFANQSEMPALYLASDILALPSRGSYETWGLAVNEAMHLGKPALVSDLVGCQTDLVIPGETGWVCRADNQASLTQALNQALQTSEPEMRRIQADVSTKISHYTYAQTSAGLLQAMASLGSS
ncbi:glycosyltransferase family 4 protein [Oleiharenicola lentus]|uniref:glycosyltransferase family 4 protein n=1 Tax=Oleiharenicola lentus TaxID=2508720 RepID=UPI003F665734